MLTPRARAHRRRVSAGYAGKGSHIARTQGDLSYAVSRGLGDVVFIAILQTNSNAKPSGGPRRAFLSERQHSYWRVYM